MITKDTLVTPNPTTTGWVNSEMRQWLIDHEDRTYRVENVVDGAAKLYKVDFWMTLDLLNEVKSAAVK